MLCDQIVLGSRPGTWHKPFGIKHPTILMRQWLKRAADEVSAAERFAMDDEAVNVIVHVQESKPSSLMAGVGICRLPYDRVWIEFDWGKRQQFLRDFGKEFGAVELPDIKTAEPIHIGYLATASDSTMRRGYFYPVLQIGTQSPIMSPIRILFDFSSFDINTVYQRHITKNTLYSEAQLATLAQQAKDWEYTPRHWFDRDQRTAMIEMNNIFDGEYDPGAVPLINEQLKLGGRGKVQEFMNHWRKNVNGEARFFLGTIMLLNSRNLAEISDPDIAQHHYAAGHQQYRNSSRLLHHKVTIRLSKVSRNRLEAAGIDTGSKMAWHKVRGHWKVRKTGVFFWRPYTRGDHTLGTVHHDYHLTR